MAAAQQWHHGGALNENPFGETLAYFRNRFFQNNGEHL